MTTEKLVITEEKLVSGPSVAEFLGLDPATIRRWVREGCPAHRFGNLVRYRISEVLAWRAKR